ncbi:MAG: hypothetical protein WAR81_11735, partial [Pseudomonadales bacterium]
SQGSPRASPPRRQVVRTQQKNLDFFQRSFIMKSSALAESSIRIDVWMTSSLDMRGGLPRLFLFFSACDPIILTNKILRYFIVRLF